MEELDRQIEVLTAEMEALRVPLGNELDVFVAASARSTVEFWQAHARAVVLGSPELAAQHGTDGTLKQLRAEVQELADRAEEYAHADLVDAPLGEAEEWPHQAVDLTKDIHIGYAVDDGPRSAYMPITMSGGAVHGPNFVREILTPSRKRLIPVLERYGYSPYVTNVHGTDYDYRYSEWSDEMMASLRRYAELHVMLLKKSAEIGRARHLKTEKLAAAAWDDAA